jgi:hypothetical protein
MSPAFLLSCHWRYRRRHRHRILYISNPRHRYSSSSWSSSVFMSP